MGKEGNLFVDLCYRPQLGSAKRNNSEDEKSGRALIIAIALSLCMHILIYFGLSIKLPISINYNESVQDNDHLVFQAAQEILEGLSKEYEISDKPDIQTLQSIFDALGMLEISDRSLKDSQKIGIYKQIIAEYLKDDSGSVGSLSQFSPDGLKDFLQMKEELGQKNGGKIFISPPAEASDRIRFNVLPSAQVNELKYVSRLRGYDKNYYLYSGGKVTIRTPTGNVVVPAGYFFRQCPYEKILSRGSNLFFFTSGFPAPLKNRNEAAFSAGQSTGSLPSPGGGYLTIFLVSHGSPSPQAKLFGRNSVPDRKKADGLPIDLWRMLDDLMGLPEPDQLTLLRRDCLQKMDPDESAAIVRNFVNNNLNTVIPYISDISAAYDYVEEVFFNNMIAGQVMEILEENLFTKTGTEILFYLAGQYQFEIQTLRYLFAAHEEAKKFLNQKYFTEEINEKKAKCYVIHEVYKQVVRDMKRQGYSNLANLVSRYRQEERKIYDLILSRGGEEKDRGLYAIGCIDWNSSRYEMAIKMWQDIDPSFSSLPLQEIREVLSRETDWTKLVRSIDAILQWYSSSESDELFLRMQKFNKWKMRADKIHW